MSTFTDVETAVGQRDPQSGALASHATGPAVTELAAAVEQFLQAGYVPAGTVTVQPLRPVAQLAASQPSVTFSACPAPTLVSISTKARLTGRVVGRHPLLVTTERTVSGWKVYDIHDESTGSCAGS